MRIRGLITIGLIIVMVATVFGNVRASMNLKSTNNSYSIETYYYNNYYAAPGLGKTSAYQDDSSWTSYFYATGDYYGTIEVGIYRFSLVTGASSEISSYWYTWGYRIYYWKSNDLNQASFYNSFWEEHCVMTGSLDHYVGGIQFKSQGFSKSHLDYNTKYYFWIEPIVLSRNAAAIEDPTYHMTWLEEIDQFNGNPNFKFYKQYSTVYSIVLSHGYVTTKGSPPSPPPGCVLKNTKILTPFGYKKVQQLKPTMIVDTYDINNSHMSVGIILRNTKSIVQTIESINNGKLWVTTYDQPIYIRNRTYEGWLHNPVDLRVGWQMYDPVHNKWINITQIKIYSGHFEVYDLQIEPYENFIANGILLKDKAIPRGWLKNPVDVKVEWQIHDVVHKKAIPR